MTGCNHRKGSNIQWRHLRTGRLVVLVVPLYMLSCSGGDHPDESDATHRVEVAPIVAADADNTGVPRRADGLQPPVLFDAPAFRLRDQSGKEFGTEDLKGSVWVATFIFTRCTATCPQQTLRFEHLQESTRHWPDQERLRLVSFTVDPRHDTSDVLRKYAESYHADHERWKFLTGDRAVLWRISKEGFLLPVSDDAASSAAPITHSPQFILVDSHLRVRGFYDSLVEEDLARLRRDLRMVLSEPEQETAGPVHVGFPADVLDSHWLSLQAAAQLRYRDEIPVYHDFRFEDRTAESGIDYINRVVPDAAKDFKFNHYDHGTGIAVADVDGDGRLDIYFVSQVGGNQLWRNLGGGRFENITATAGVSLAGRVSVAASFADTDNDGDPDLLVTTTRHGNAFFENEGGGRYRDVTAEAGLDYSGHSSAGVFFDYDRDGLLDLLLTNVGVFTTDQISYSGDPERRENPYFVGTNDSFAGHLKSELAERSILYHNEGGNRFRDVTEAVGLVDDLWSGGATPLDVNVDGWPDLYVLNMQGNDECYVNVDGARFERRTEQIFDRFVWGGMGVKSFDYDNDGRLDLFVTNMHADMLLPERRIDEPEARQKTPIGTIPASYLRSRHAAGRNIYGNALYRNEGDGRFRDVSDEVNGETYWPWGPSVGDLNGDGFQDLFVTASMNLGYRYQPNNLLLNDQAARFRDTEFVLGVEPRRGNRTASKWFDLDCSGTDANHPGCAGQSGRVVVWAALGSRSSVIFDLDNDGDLDLVTNEFNSPPQVLVSNLAEQNPGLNFVKFQLQGVRSNRDGLGAVVKVTAEGQSQTQVHDGQSGYLSQSALPLYFGLGAARSIDRVVVQWPGGERQVLDGPFPANQDMLILEATPK